MAPHWREKDLGMLRGRKQGGILLLASSIVSLHSNILLSFLLVKWEITCLMGYEHLCLIARVRRVCVFSSVLLTFIS